jgi:hypothetical protein
MGSEVETTGFTPEQQAGLAAGALLAVAGVGIALFRRRRRRKKSQIETTAERIAENPTLRNLYSSAREALEEARGHIDPKTIESAKKELSRQYEAGASAWHSDVEPTARELANRALETAQRFRTEGAERSRELSKRWEKEYAPAARSMAEEAVHEADQIIGTARKRATEISEVARKEYLPKIVPLAAAAGGAIASKFTEGSQKVQKQVRNGYKPDISLPKEWSKRGRRRKSPSVIERTGKGVKDVTGQIVMIGFWGAALGAVVYYGLLDEERREKVRSFLTDTFEQMSELIEDFRDEDVFSDVADAAERF